MLGNVCRPGQHFIFKDKGEQQEFSQFIRDSVLYCRRERKVGIILLPETVEQMRKQRRYQWGHRRNVRNRKYGFPHAGRVPDYANWLSILTLRQLHLSYRCICSLLRTTNITIHKAVMFNKDTLEAFIKFNIGE
jgi:hypothetical protein